MGRAKKDRAADDDRFERFKALAASYGEYLPVVLVNMLRSSVIKDSEGRVLYRAANWIKGAGAMSAASLLEGCLFWAGKSELEGDWFWKHQKEWERRHGLTRDNLETGIKHLKKFASLFKYRHGLGKRGEFWVDVDGWYSAVENYLVALKLSERKLRLVSKEEGATPAGDSPIPESPDAPIQNGAFPQSRTVHSPDPSMHAVENTASTTVDNSLSAHARATEERESSTGDVFKNGEKGSNDPFRHAIPGTDLDGPFTPIEALQMFQSQRTDGKQPMSDEDRRNAERLLSAGWTFWQMMACWDYLVEDPGQKIVNWYTVGKRITTWYQQARRLGREDGSGYESSFREFSQEEYSAERACDCPVHACQVDRADTPASVAETCASDAIGEPGEALAVRDRVEDISPAPIVPPVEFEPASREEVDSALADMWSVFGGRPSLQVVDRRSRARVRGAGLGAASSDQVLITLALICGFDMNECSGADAGDLSEAYSSYLSLSKGDRVSELDSFGRWFNSKEGRAPSPMEVINRLREFRGERCAQANW